MKAKDKNKSALEMRERRLPIVSECRLKFKMSLRAIAVEVQERLELTSPPSAATIKADWDLLKREWRKEATINSTEALNEELMNIELLLEELWHLYNRSRKETEEEQTIAKSASSPKGDTNITTTVKKKIERIGDVAILAEIRKNIELRTKLLGLDKTTIDVTSGGDKIEFKGFAGVLPVINDIEQYISNYDKLHKGNNDG